MSSQDFALVIVSLTLVALVALGNEAAKDAIIALKEAIKHFINKK